MLEVVSADLDVSPDTLNNTYFVRCKISVDSVIELDDSQETRKYYENLGKTLVHGVLMATLNQSPNSKPKPKVVKF